MSISPQRLMAAVVAAQKLIADLPDDEKLRTDMVDGETEALDLMDRIAESVIADEALAEGAKERARRLEARAEKRRDIIRQMLEALDLREPLQRPLYTASVAYNSKVLVTDADLLPREFIREAPDKIALGKALRNGTSLPGATLSNPTPSLSLRTK